MVRNCSLPPSFRLSVPVASGDGVIRGPPLGLAGRVVHHPFAGRPFPTETRPASTSMPRPTRPTSWRSFSARSPERWLRASRRSSSQTGSCHTNRRWNGAGYRTRTDDLLFTRPLRPCCRVCVVAGFPCTQAFLSRAATRGYALSRAQPRTKCRPEFDALGRSVSRPYCL